MSTSRYRALFADLIYNEEGEPAKIVVVGGVDHYAIPDEGFLRHAEAEDVDRQIVALIQERIKSMEDAVTEGLVHMLGEETVFTRPAIRHAIDHMERILEPGAVDRDEFRTALWMTKFRATVNVHGEVVGIHMPGLEAERE